MLPEHKRRIRWIPREEADRLLVEVPPQLRAMAQFSLATGLRRANVTGPEWSQVDLGRRVAWVRADQAKADTPIGVPLNAEAVVVLREQLGRHPVRVFTCQGKPVGSCNTKARRTSGGFIAAATATLKNAVFFCAQMTVTKTHRHEWLEAPRCPLRKLFVC